MVDLEVSSLEDVCRTQRRPATNFGLGDRHSKAAKRTGSRCCYSGSPKSGFGSPQMMLGWSKGRYTDHVCSVNANTVSPAPTILGVEGEQAQAEMALTDTDCFDTGSSATDLLCTTDPVIGPSLVVVAKPEVRHRKVEDLRIDGCTWTQSCSVTDRHKPQAHKAGSWTDSRLRRKSSSFDYHMLADCTYSGSGIEPGCMLTALAVTGAGTLRAGCGFCTEALVGNHRTAHGTATGSGHSIVAAAAAAAVGLACPCHRHYRS